MATLTEIEAIDIIAAVMYQNKLNLDILQGKLNKLPTGSFKDTFMLYIENQRNWLCKMERGLKKIGINAAMQKDLNSTERIGAIRCGGFSSRKPNTKYHS